MYVCACVYIYIYIYMYQGLLKLPLRRLKNQFGRICTGAGTTQTTPTPTPNMY